MPRNSTRPGSRNRVIVSRPRRRRRGRGLAAGAAGGSAAAVLDRTSVSIQLQGLRDLGDVLGNLLRAGLAGEERRHAVVDLLAERGRVRLVQVELELRC